MSRITEICNAFNTKASEYTRAAKIQYEIGSRMMARLAYMTMQPKRILNLGSGPGVFTAELQTRYPDAEVINVDMAFTMLREASALDSGALLCNADMMSLPFGDATFDLVFANQVIHWASALPALFREVNRVMVSGGCLMFSTLGPDTFYELRHAFDQADKHAHTNSFVDMHVIGDTLLAEFLLDPVVDMEVLTVHYESIAQLLHALRSQGVRNIHPKRRPGLMSRKVWQAFEAAFEQFRTEDNKLPLTYEVVYGHAWKGEKRRLDKGAEARITMEEMRMMLAY